MYTSRKNSNIIKISYENHLIAFLDVTKNHFDHNYEYHNKINFKVIFSNLYMIG